MRAHPGARALGVAVLLAMACRGPVEAPAPAPEDLCTWRSDVVRDARAPLSVGLLHRVRADRAPRPANPSERFLFRQLYETLVRVDCAGRVYPALAESWSRGPGDDTWTFRLRPEARFWDGSPVSAATVRAAWLRNEAARTLIPWAGSPEASLQEAGPRSLRVELVAGRVSGPVLFAHPSLAIAGAEDESGWPLGSGPYRVTAPAPAWVGTSLADLPARPRAGTRLPQVEFRVRPAADGRDLLDVGTGLLVARDPAVVEYARRGAGLLTRPLPWDRTYVVLTPSRLRAARSAYREGRRPPPDVPASLQRDLAENAVRAEARASEPPYWWNETAVCVPGDRAARPPSTVADRIVYSTGDPVARELAGRIVALAAVAEHGTRPRELLRRLFPAALSAYPDLSAEGLDPDEFEAALSTGADFAYILALERRVYAPCYELERVFARAPWLAGGAEPGVLLAPLVDTRARAVLRRDVPTLRIDWDATLRLPEVAPEGAGIP